MGTRTDRHFADYYMRGGASELCRLDHVHERRNDVCSLEEVFVGSEPESTVYIRAFTTHLRNRNELINCDGKASAVCPFDVP